MIRRWDSAAIVPNTSELLPEPETPVNAVSRRLGISTLMSLRLFTRAPCTRSTSWLSAAVPDTIYPTLRRSACVRVAAVTRTLPCDPRASVMRVVRHGCTSREPLPWAITRA